MVKLEPASSTGRQRVKETIAGINFTVVCRARAHSAVKGHLSWEQKQNQQRIMELRCEQLELLSLHNELLTGSRTGTDLDQNPQINTPLLSYWSGKNGGKQEDELRQLDVQRSPPQM